MYHKKINYLFEHIYCLHLIDFKDRLPNMLSEFERVGIDINASNFHWHYAVKNPFYNYIRTHPDIPIYTTTTTEFEQSRFNCSFEHYCIIKEAYELGYENILVLEDDNIFLKDVDMIHTILNAMPENYDIVLFNRFAPQKNLNKLIDECKINEYYTDFTHTWSILCSGACYFLNRVGMLHIINIMEQLFLPFDFTFNAMLGINIPTNFCVWVNHMDDDINRAFATIPISKQSNMVDDENTGYLYNV